MRLRAKLAGALVALLVAGGWLVAEVRTTSELTIQMREIGKELKCQCGCAYTVADCNMLYCHFRDPVNQDIEAGLKAGLDGPAIISKLFAKYGEVLRSAPKAEGFGAIGWAMPFVALALGLLAAPCVVRHWRNNQAAVESASETPIDQATIDAFEKEIERDLAKDA